MVQLIDAGLDWLTMTWKHDDPMHKTVMDVVDAEMERDESPEEPMIPLKLSNYVGWEQGTLKIGHREDSMIVQCTGRRARIIGEAFRHNEIEGRATRIDFQVTGQTDQKSKIYLGDIERRVRAACGEKAGRQAKNVTAFEARGRPCGVAIGHRTSTNYSRIYDKTLESRSRLPPGIIRFEHEAKGKRAVQLWKRYRKCAEPYFESLNVCRTQFAPMDVDMTWFEGGEHIEYESDYKPTSGAKKMTWFSTHVRASVAYCVKIYGRDAVIKALGLD